MATNLAAVLLSLNSADATTRNQAEAQLSHMSVLPGYSVALTQMVLSPEPPEFIRLMAGVLLRRHIEQFWVIEVVEEATNQIPEADKAVIRQMLPAGLSLTERKLRSNMALCIATIATYDVPRAWPTLLTDLCKCFASGNATLIDGAVRTLEEFVMDNTNDEQIPSIVNDVFPALHKLYLSTSSESIRARVASVIYSGTKFLGVITAAYQNDSRQVASNVMQVWMPIFIEVIRQRDTTQGASKLKIRVMLAVTAFAQFFSKQFSPYAAAVLECVWSSLCSGAVLFTREAVEQDTLDDTHQDSDGNVLGYETLVSIYLNFVAAVARKKRLAKMVSSNLTPLFNALIAYLQLTVNQTQSFLNDPNEFIAGEDDDYSIEHSVRNSCVLLLQDLIDTYGPTAITALMTSVQSRLEESQSIRTTSQIWWKLREACLYAVGCVGETLSQSPQLFNVSNFVTQVLADDVQSENPFLRGRSLWVASQLLNMEAALATQLLVAAIRALTYQKDHLSVRFCACRLVAELIGGVDKETVRPALNPAVLGVCELFQLCTADSIHTPVDTLAALLDVIPEVTVECAPFVIGQLLNVWKMFPKDNMVCQMIWDTIDCVMKNPAAVAPINLCLLPAIHEVFQNHNTPEQFYLVETATMLLCASAKHTQNSINIPGLSHLFSFLVQLLLTSDDSSLLQSGTQALCGYMSSSGESLVQWKDATIGASSLDLIVQVLQRLLHPQASEQAAIYIGPVVVRLITSCGPAVSSITPQILQAVLARLSNAERPSLIESLIFVFARLIHLQPNETLDFLAAAKLASGEVALPFVIRTWAENQSSFYGDYKIKVTLLALAKLFQLNHPGLNSIQVKGDIIQTTGRSTRSRGPAQYQSVPFQHRVFVIMAEQLVHDADTSTGQWALDEEGYDGFSDDEDEEYDAVFGGGAPGGLGAFAAIEDLSDIIRNAMAEEADDDDEGDAADDPIALLDLSQQLKLLFRTMQTSDPQTFQQLAQTLSAEVGPRFLQVLNEP